jgi:hypothetical protein
MAQDFVSQAIGNASEEIQGKVGLNLVVDPGFLSLYGLNHALIARVPVTPDPLDDLDLIRSVWFASSQLMSNSSWD